MTFFCLGLGAPEPTLTWLKDSETIRPSKKVAINNEMRFLQLFVVSVVDAGKYTCVYKNKHGEDRKSAILRVDGIDPGQCKLVTGGAQVPSRVRLGGTE